MQELRKHAYRQFDGEIVQAFIGIVHREGIGEIQMGKFYAMDEYGTDIKSQLEKMKIALKESEDKYLSLYNNNHLIMMLIDPESGDIIDANLAACNYYGYSKKEITSKKIYDINVLSNDGIQEEINLALKEKRN